jgi:nickel-type superoxide dismutase maturation protease|tara:strand:+ start:253 stop:609 length:357 start_codon:yes stop_codon:yes gene_type:complete
LTATVLKELLALAVGKRKKYRVQGESMLPILEPGDVVIIRKDKHCEAGDIVVARHPYKNTTLIKYVAYIDENKLVELSSPHGTDSRQFGKPPMSNIIGVATYNLTQRALLVKEATSTN